MILNRYETNQLNPQSSSSTDKNNTIPTQCPQSLPKKRSYSKPEKKWLFDKIMVPTRVANSVKMRYTVWHRQQKYTTALCISPGTKKRSAIFLMTVSMPDTRLAIFLPAWAGALCRIPEVSALL